MLFLLHAQHISLKKKKALLCFTKRATPWRAQLNPVGIHHTNRKYIDFLPLFCEQKHSILSVFPSFMLNFRFFRVLPFLWLACEFKLIFNDLRMKKNAQYFLTSHLHNSTASFTNPQKFIMGGIEHLIAFWSLPQSLFHSSASQLAASAPFGVPFPE